MLNFLRAKRGKAFAVYCSWANTRCYPTVRDALFCALAVGVSTRAFHRHPPSLSDTAVLLRIDLPIQPPFPTPSLLRGGKIGDGGCVTVLSI